MLLEYVTVGLAILAAIAATVAFIYRKGRTDGIDNACEDRIKESIADVKTTMEKDSKENNATHKLIFSNMSKIESKIDNIQGSQEVIKDLITRHITK